MNDDDFISVLIAVLLLLFLFGCSCNITKTTTSINGDNNCVTVQNSDRVLTDQDIKEEEE